MDKRRIDMLVGVFQVPVYANDAVTIGQNRTTVATVKGKMQRLGLTLYFALLP